MERRTPKQYNTGTRELLLDTAERHFALYGYAAASLRAITTDADLNSALIRYHYKDKKNLYLAVIERFAAPVVAEQLKMLHHALSARSPGVREVVASFYAPPIRLVHALGAEKGETLSLFLGRMQTEPEPVYTMIDPHFAACRTEYIRSFKAIVPGLDEAEYQWRFEFMLSLIVTFLTRQKMIYARYTKKKDWEPNEVVARLVAFCEAGLKQPFRWE